MGAPLGFKTFATGDVLTAADTNGYLMQGVWTFASAAARDAAVTSPQEGNMCYLKDTDAVQYYSGSAWTAVSAASAGSPTNLLLNANFAINQRVYVSGATLASGSYGFDRWKSNFATTTLTFTGSTQGQSLTINIGGGLQQVIEQGLVPAGTYTLSWTGTATGRVYNSGGTAPSYAASPVTFTADGTANVVVEFTAVGVTKTLSKVQFNAGTNTTWALATPTLQTELAACQRYFYRLSSVGTDSYMSYATGQLWTTSAAIVQLNYISTMRIKPTATFTTASGFLLATNSATGAVTSFSVSDTGFQTIQITANTASALGAGYAVRLVSNNNTTSYIELSAEI